MSVRTFGDGLASGAAGPVRALRGLRAVAPGRVADALIAERERWALWLPVGIGAGCALYFTLSAEPSPWLGAVCLLVAGVAAVAVRGRPVALVLAIAGMAISAGFAAAQFRARQVEAPILSEPIRFATVTGRIVSNRAHNGARRLLIGDVGISGIEEAATPARVRLRVNGADGSLLPGDRIRMRASLSPPPGPTVPGGFDFARQVYFKRIGAVGFTYGPPRTVSAVDGADRGGGWPAAIARVRQAATARILAALDGDTGAVAAALLTGERGEISEAVLADMRDSGLAHLLAVSGLHVGLIGAILFFVSRAALALVEPLALRYPIKKWAALIALAGTLGYLVLTGMAIPTQRAVLMSALVIAAILLDRTGLSMRSIAWAAAAVLLLQPESILSASFHMSFAAVTALIAVFEDRRVRAASSSSSGRGARGIPAYLAGVAIATVIASLATAPFAVFHFNRIAAYGLAGNLIAVPVTALWIMPWGVLALALMPLGLESLALAPMGWGLDAVLAVAGEIASWQGAVVHLPAMPLAGLLVATFGGLWLCLWRGRWRWIGLPIFLAALATPGLDEPPDLLADGRARLFALRGADGMLALSSRSAGRYAGGVWLRRNGQEAAASWPADGMRCDSIACIGEVRGRVAAFVFDSRALAEDCRAADVIIGSVPAGRSCRAPVVIDRFDLFCKGAHALYFTDAGVRVETAEGTRGVRPWTRRAPPWCGNAP